MQTLTALKGNSLCRRSRTTIMVALVWMFSAGVGRPHVQPTIHRVAGGNDVKPLLSLLAGGADPSAIGPGGRTPLHFAASGSENPEMILALVAAGAYVDAADDDGFSPLHVAIRENRGLEIVATFVTAGARVTQPVLGAEYTGRGRAGGSDWSGWTALHLAARYSQDPAIVSLLINMGAHMNIAVYARSFWSGSRRMNELDIAVANQNDSVIRVLQGAGSKPYVEPRVTETDDDSGGFDWGKAIGIAGVVATGAVAVDAGVPVEDVVEVAGAAVADIAGDTGGENLARVSGNQPMAGSGTAATTREGRSGTAQAVAGLASAMSGDCEIPGFAEEDVSAFDPDNTGLSWCPGDVGLQMRSQALNVELSRCMFTLGRVTMATIASHRANIQDSCKILEGLGPDRCQCPSSYYELGRD